MEQKTLDKLGGLGGLAVLLPMLKYVSDSVYFRAQTDEIAGQAERYYKAHPDIKRYEELPKLIEDRLDVHISTDGSSETLLDEKLTRMGRAEQQYDRLIDLMSEYEMLRGSQAMETQLQMYTSYQDQAASLRSISDNHFGKSLGVSMGGIVLLIVGLIYASKWYDKRRKKVETQD
jgi:hypothetical protein